MPKCVRAVQRNDQSRDHVTGNSKPHGEHFHQGAFGQDLYQNRGHHHHLAVPKFDPVSEGTACGGRCTKGHRGVRANSACISSHFHSVPSFLTKSTSTHSSFDARCKTADARNEIHSMQASEGSGQPRSCSRSWKDRLVSLYLCTVVLQNPWMRSLCISQDRLSALVLCLQDGILCR